MEGYILGVYAGAVRVGTLGYDQPQDAFQFAFALADFCVRLGIERRYFARELTRLCGLALQEAPAQAADPAYMGEESPSCRALPSSWRPERRPCWPWRATSRNSLQTTFSRPLVVDVARLAAAAFCSTTPGQNARVHPATLCDGNG